MSFISLSSHLIINIVILPKNDISADQAREERVYVCLLVPVRFLLQQHKRLIDKYKRAQVCRVLLSRPVDELDVFLQAGGLQICPEYDEQGEVSVIFMTKYIWFDLSYLLAYHGY